MKNHFVSVAALSLLLAQPMWSAPATSDRAVRLSLCGFKMEDWPSPHIYDPQSGYYLWASGDCDGAHLSLDLSPDWSEFVGEKPTNVKQQTLPSLRNGWGVNIGDTPAQVRRKLGRRADSRYYDAPNHALSLNYEAHLGKQNPDKRNWQYTATYQFKNGKLRSIGYGLNDLDSACNN